ncbi:MAG: hypothetical protein AAF734_08190, partial [Bacteroidota bacterium]
LCMLPAFTWGQSNILTFYTDHFEKRILDYQVWHCDSLNDLGLLLQKHPSITRYDMVRVEVRCQYFDDYQKTKKWTKLHMAFGREIPFYKSSYKVQYDTLTQHPLWLVHPENTASDFPQVFTHLGQQFLPSTSSFRAQACRDGQANREIYAVVRGYFKVREKTLKDADGQPYQQDVYGPGETIAASQVIRIVADPPRVLTQPRRIAMTKEEKTERYLNDSLFVTVEEAYTKIERSPEGDFKRIKKKRLYYAYQAIKAQKLEELEAAKNDEAQKTIVQFLEQLVQRMEVLAEEKTHDLEKALKEEMTVGEMIQTLGL